MALVAVVPMDEAPEDPISEVLIQPVPPIALILPPIPPPQPTVLVTEASVAPVPPPIPPPQPTVLVAGAPAPLAAPVPPPEASAAPPFSIVAIGDEHFHQLMQLVAIALQTHQPATAKVFGQFDLPRVSAIAREF
ncbi:uncharacterized protein LOC131224921 [Magnolia sinica]|uniref:uncharacterized protein LOC131224921 n=1 Tax=Magnolia sinica TaxID=86752 RepID=UPI0026588F60|nr:uncharacterized protein LOC131224921 [Magnolia sinica]